MTRMTGSPDPGAVVTDLDVPDLEFHRQMLSPVVS